MRPARTLLALTTILACLSSARAQSLRTNYDRFEDVTTVTTDVIRIKTLEQNERREGKLVLVRPEMPFFEFSMMAMYKFSGKQKPERPAWFILGAVTKSRNWVFHGDADLYAIADGERLKVGRMSHSGVVENFLSVVSVKETLLGFAPAETFLKTANAKKVEMRLGRFEFELTEDQLKMLRELAEYATSGKPASSPQP